MTLKGFNFEDYVPLQHNETLVIYLSKKTEVASKQHKKHLDGETYSCLPTVILEKTYVPDSTKQAIDIPIKDLKGICLISID